MHSDKTVAIVSRDASGRRSMWQLLKTEGFPVEAFSGREELPTNIESGEYGCVLVDLDPAGDDAPEQSLLHLATHWSRDLPVIVTVSDPSLLPADPLLPGHVKSAGDTRLLYLVYGALSEPQSRNSKTRSRC